MPKLTPTNRFLSFFLVALLAQGCSESSAVSADIRGGCVAGLKYPTPGDPKRGMIWIPAGQAIMGEMAVLPEERYGKRAVTEGFWMTNHEVTVGEFARFVAATGYVTVAERGLDKDAYPDMDPQLLEPGGAVFHTAGPGQSHASSGWSYVAGASWRAPEGNPLDLSEESYRPVTQIAYEDAIAYATWLGHELPTEDEWEYAALGGAEGTMFPWGDSLMIEGRAQANYWQGSFPVLNTKEDGYVGVAPIGCFPPNGYGLYDVIGNVWEMVETPYAARRGTQSDPSRSPVTIKGGSFLCATNFCGRFRPAARQPNERDLTTNHIGFRTIYRDSGPDPTR